MQILKGLLVIAEAIRAFRGGEILPDGRDACYVEGRVEGRQCFIVKMEY